MILVSEAGWRLRVRIGRMQHRAGVGVDDDVGVGRGVPLDRLRL